MSDQAANLALLLSEAGRLSDMADRVAGFAITSNLLLTFSCLKEIGGWVQRETKAFLVGTAVGGCVYIGAVWWLYLRQISIQSGIVPATDMSVFQSVGWTLVWGRTLGIAAFTLIATLAVLGTRKARGFPASGHQDHS